MVVDVYMTTEGSSDTTAAIRASKAKLGIRSDIAGRATGAEFIDFPFTNPQATFRSHLRVVQAVQPELTVAPDVEKGRTLDEAVEMGDELLQYAEDVIIVPKTVRPGEVPDRFRVGVPTAKFGTSAPWGLFEYLDTGPVHVLGGPPGDQLEAGKTLPVASVDTSTLSQRARFGTYDRERGAVDSPNPSWDYRQRLEYALNEYWAAWNE